MTVLQHFPGICLKKAVPCGASHMAIDSECDSKKSPVVMPFCGYEEP